MKPDPLPPTNHYDAAKAMADLVWREMGVMVDERDVLIMFSKHWHRLSVLAHAIHEGIDREVRAGREQAMINARQQCTP